MFKYFRKAGDRHSPAARISASGFPDDCKSNACPLRKSCNRYVSKSGTCASFRKTRKARVARAAEIPSKSLCPTGSFSKTGPSTCTGHVALDSLHQQPRTKRLPKNLFFLPHHKICSAMTLRDKQNTFSSARAPIARSPWTARYAPLGVLGRATLVKALSIRKHS